MRRGCGGCLGWLAAAVLAAACGGEPSGAWRAGLVPVPEPPLARREAADREKLAALRHTVEERLADPRCSAAEAAAAFGELGRVYLAHELPEAAQASLANAAATAPDDFRWRYLLGLIAQQEGKLEEAAGRLEEALERAPEEPATLLRLGQADLDRHRLDQARRWFERALPAAGAEAAARFGLGRVAAAEGRFEEAVAHFERALALQPDASAVHHPLGLALRALGDRERAREHLARAGEEPVEFADPLVEELSPLVTGARSYLRRGDRAREAGDQEQALRHYRLAVEADPDLAAARHSLGTALAERGQMEEALVHLRRATELEPNFPEAHFNLGTALLRLDRRDEAQAAFDRVLALDPDHSAARLRRAALWRERGEPERARADLEAILARDPLHAEALENLALLLARQGEAEDAVGLLRRKLGENPSPQLAARLHFTLAYLANQRGRLEESIAAYRRAVAAQGDFAEAHFNLAVSLVLARRFAEAAGQFGEVLRLEPANPRAHLGRGQAWSAAGRWGEARAAFEEGLARLPQDPALAQALAELLAASPDPAARDGERALALALAAYQATRGVESSELVAMALAELGRFGEAAAWQRDLLGQAEAAGAPAEVKARLAARLEGFARGEPVRLAPMADGSP